MRPGPRWQFSVSPFYDRVTEPQQYVSTLSGGRPVTYDSRYVFAFIDRSTASMEFRLGLTLKPDVNLDVYAEPFAASGHYYDYGELLAPGSRERLKYGTGGTTLTINPDGSQVVTVGGRDDQPSQSRLQHAVVPQQRRVALGMAHRHRRSTWCGSRIAPAPRSLGTRVNVGDAFRSVTAPGPNIFLIKTSFWIPVK